MTWLIGIIAACLVFNVALVAWLTHGRYMEARRRARASLAMHPMFRPSASRSDDHNRHRRPNSRHREARQLR